jgi:biotin synthase
VPINLLNPRPGTKFGDRALMDPWDVVKWIAIFRLILPEALFRLCGGRVENLGELQATAVKAGLNGVMMGNFLTTLGNTPDEDKAMFAELGLNVTPHADNGANPRPDNRSGWLQGETPDVVSAALEPPEAGDPPALTVRLWDPTSQLKFAAKRSVPPRPDGAANSGQGRETREAAARRANVT